MDKPAVRSLESSRERNMKPFSIRDALLENDTNFSIGCVKTIGVIHLNVSR